MLTALFSSDLPVVAGLSLTHIGLSSLGVLPKLGPGRALFLAVRSKFFSHSVMPPIRPNLRQHSRGDLKPAVNWDSSHLPPHTVVRGPPGSGKSYIIDDALQGTPGVIKTSISGYEDKEWIVNKALRAVSGDEGFSSRMAARRALRVIKSYKHLNSIWTGLATTSFAGLLLGFDPILTATVGTISAAVSVFVWYFLSPRGRPILVLDASNRIGCKGRELFDAIEKLKKHGLDVIVEGTVRNLETILHDGHWDFTRHVEVPPMTQSELLQLPQVQKLMKIFAFGADDVLWELLWQVFGGIPKNYDELLQAVQKATDASKLQALENFVVDALGQAVHDLDYQLRFLLDKPDVKTLLTHYNVETGDLLDWYLYLRHDATYKLAWPQNKYTYSDYREGWLIDGELVTMDAAMKFVLIHNLEEKEIPSSLEELKKLAQESNNVQPKLPQV